MRVNIVAIVGVWKQPDAWIARVACGVSVRFPLVALRQNAHSRVPLAYAWRR